MCDLNSSDVYRNRSGWLCIERTYFDDFLAFPPEYVALLGLGVLFIILFIIVVIVICVTARVSRVIESLLVSLITAG